MGSLELLMVESVEQSIVLPSPVPRRSPYGRMQVTEDILGFEPKRSLRSQSSQSLSSEAKNLEDSERRKSMYVPFPPSPPLLLRPPTQKSPLVKSSSGLRNDEISVPKLSPSVWSEPRHLSRGKEEEEFLSRGNARVEAEGRNQTDGLLVEKYVMTVSAGETFAADKDASKIGEDDDPKETRDFLDRVLVETDDDDNDGHGERLGNGEEKGKEDDFDGTVDEAADVDKMADEFIAKFREQIRLQRIDSIKRSTWNLGETL
ncbi:hypothetical protein Ancab_033285 [Ancistrocladus abbreviatus]